MIPQASPLIAVQGIAPSVFLEGASHMLDFLREEGGVNAVFISTHGGMGYSSEDTLKDWADHGVRLELPPGRQSPTSWIRGNPSLYRNTFLGQVRDPAQHLWADRDVLEELLPEARKRGMKVYARHLENFHAAQARKLPGLAQVLSVDIYGRRAERPCWNHPGYRAWWLAMTEEWFSQYAIDGLILGPERDAPFGPLLYNADAPVCFCEHCRAKAHREGIRVDRALEGFRQMHELATTIQATGARPREGAFMAFLRLMMKHPEVFQWEKLVNDSKWSLHAEIRGLAHILRPGVEVGWMVPVYPLMHDVFSRALAYDYAEMAAFSDFLKPNVYQDVNAARLHDWIGHNPPLYVDLAREQLHDLIYALFGYSGGGNPDHAASATSPSAPIT